jgi:hypothetical protein
LTIALVLYGEIAQKVKKSRISSASHSHQPNSSCNNHNNRNNHKVTQRITTHSIFFQGQAQPIAQDSLLCSKRRRYFMAQDDHPERYFTRWRFGIPVCTFDAASGGV